MKIFIPCAGTGSRLEYLTKNLNKSLVSINNKPAIAYLIEKFSKEHTFVIALGYKGDLLKQFLTIAYPDKKIEYVDISKFEGPGSGLGLTLYESKNYLQEPFLFIPTDSLFEESEDFLINNPDTLFFSEELDQEFQYRKIESQNGILSKILEKTERGLIYTGICHIHSYLDFWNISINEQLIAEGETYCLNAMSKNIPIKCKKINWKDIGNLKSLDLIKKEKISKYNILEKENESIWFLKDKVIKYHHDPEFIANRVKRSKVLTGFIPNLISYSENMYSYQYVEGDTLSEKFDLNIMSELIIFLNKFWKSDSINDYQDFKSKCLKFYQTKTLNRLKQYQSIAKNDCQIINGLHVGKIEDLLSKVDWDRLSNGTPSNFHGDLHFENILKTADSFCLIDWRQEFENNLLIGDIYYDFAKLLHGMIVAHDVIKKNLYQVHYENSNSVKFDFCVKHINLLAEQRFFDFLKKNQYDVWKVKILTALIFLNIAPLHHEPYNHLLYYLGKMQLFLNLMEKS